MKKSANNLIMSSPIYLTELTLENLMKLSKNSEPLFPLTLPEEKVLFNSKTKVKPKISNLPAEIKPSN